MGDTRINRRRFLTRSGALGMTLGAGFGAALPRASAASVKPPHGRKVIVIALDGFDPFLSERMMDEGRLPNLAKLRATGGYARLATSIPPHTPVAFADFINGANPGSHGIFDWLARDPARQFDPESAVARMLAGRGGWEVGEHRLPLTFWPFGDVPAAAELRRRGVPFWDYLDAAGVPTWIHGMPSNYPPSESKHGRHYSITGMGTPDVLGTYGTHHLFSEDGPYHAIEQGGRRWLRIVFERGGDTAKCRLAGPDNAYLRTPRRSEIEFAVHRDTESRAAAIEIQDQLIVLKEHEWSEWVRLEFRLGMPSFLPDESVAGICRFCLLEAAPNLRLYVSPVNVDPGEPSIRLSQPESFVSRLAGRVGMFSTIGFHEDHSARSMGTFNDEEYACHTDMVLDERIRLFDDALDCFNVGLLFFYFGSTDLQPHMYWWDSDEAHPFRSPQEAVRWHGHVMRLYEKMDGVVGRALGRFGADAMIMVMSDHGFANFKRQFNLNTWLRENGYIRPATCTSLMKDVDWSATRAYGLGLNGLYLNLKGRERDGIVVPGEREALIRELIEKLEAARDVDGRPPIAKVYRADQVYSGPCAHEAPDLVIGYHRRFQCSWDTSMGGLSEEVFSDNHEPWSATHCIAAEQIPGVLFLNRGLPQPCQPRLTDLAPTILAEFGLPCPATMEGRSIFST